tara:strand:+ start:887 stop:1081 length:195 start_codon:yes stop_codon:yes gene_type:complete
MPNNTNFITIKNEGETPKAQAIIGFASSTPFDMAKRVSTASAKLHAKQIPSHIRAIVFFSILLI